MGDGAGTEPEQAMSRRLIVRPEAEAEMAEAFDWYEQRLPGLGSEFLLCVDAVFNAILRNPQHWAHVHRVAGSLASAWLRSYLPPLRRCRRRSRSR